MRPAIRLARFTRHLPAGSQTAFSKQKHEGALRNYTPRHPLSSSYKHLAERKEKVPTTRKTIMQREH